MKIGLIGDSLTEGKPGVSFAKILQERYQHLIFDNLGKPGETVKSLYKRLNETKLESNYDITFLWIGVNDVYSKLLKVQAQPIAKDYEEFQYYYKKNVKLVLECSKKVVVVSPALVGENPMNTANKELKELSTIIQLLAEKISDLIFLNLQEVFTRKLAVANSSNYISTKVMRVIIDTLFYKSSTKIDQLSKKRGLQFTLDGVHLNSTGASIVANKYASIIENTLNKTDKKVGN